jgi:hypothetical protein
VAVLPRHKRRRSRIRPAHALTGSHEMLPPPVGCLPRGELSTGVSLRRTRTVSARRRRRRRPPSHKVKATNLPSRQRLGRTSSKIGNFRFSLPRCRFVAKTAASTHCSTALPWVFREYPQGIFAGQRNTRMYRHVPTISQCPSHADTATLQVRSVIRSSSVGCPRSITYPVRQVTGPQSIPVKLTADNSSLAWTQTDRHLP